ncbi:MAG: flagellar motor switch protein FliM [Firmicutes bacterium]|nr:flagellar motor switch protein FliM [Bacillota bacterium]
MRDVLSQSEIDSLVKALSLGQIEPEQKSAAAADGEVMLYDFRRPNKFSKEQMRTLHIIHENFARILSNFLSAYLRTPVQLKLAGVSQVTFEEFIFSLPTPTLMTVFRTTEEIGSALLETNTQFVFPIIDLLFGGGGETAKKTRELTEIEISVMRRIVAKMLENLRYAWEDILALSPEIENMDTTPQFNQMIASNETVALITMTTQIRNSQGLINLCFPYITLERVLPNLTAQHWFSASYRSAGNERRALENVLERVGVEVSAVLGNTMIRVDDFLKFEVGDVILLDQKVGTPLTVMVEDRPVFKAQPGVRHRHRALQLLGLRGEGDDERRPAFPG